MFVGVRRSDQNRVVVLDYLPSRPPPLVSRQHRAGLPTSGAALPVLGAGFFEEAFPGGSSGPGPLLLVALGFSKAPRDSFGCSRRCINNRVERMQEHTHTGKNNRQKEKNIRKSPDSITSPECFVFKSFPCRTVSCLTTNFLFGCSFCTFASRREGSGFQTWAFRCEVPPPTMDPHREF